MPTRKEIIETRIDDYSFRVNEGFANEVGCHIVAYDPKEEFNVRHDVKTIINEVKKYKTYRVLEFNLFETLIQILRKNGVLDKFIEFEADETKPRDRITQMISNYSDPRDLYDEFISENGELIKEDIVFITGVGLMYPFINNKAILTIFHSYFKENPVVYFLPGQYDGKSIRLFNTIDVDNFYRAFKLG